LSKKGIFMLFAIVRFSGDLLFSLNQLDDKTSDTKVEVGNSTTLPFRSQQYAHSSLSKFGYLLVKVTYRTRYMLNTFPFTLQEFSVWGFALDRLD